MSNENHCEIERKYLIAMPDTAFLRAQSGCEVWEIEQTYLTGEHGETRRVRRIVQGGAVRYCRTVKRRISDLSCEEREDAVDRETYEALLREADAALRPIVKTRYRVPYEGQVLEFDVYPFWSDRAVLEIELEREDQPVRMPQWVHVLRDVTADRRYKNIRLAASVPMDDLSRM